MYFTPEVVHEINHLKSKCKKAMPTSQTRRHSAAHKEMKKSGDFIREIFNLRIQRGSLKKAK